MIPENENLKQYLRDYVERITTPTREPDTYVCPLCGSGTGPSGTAAFKLNPRKDYQTWTCFGKCEGKHGDLFDLISKVEHIDMPAAVRRAHEMYGNAQPAKRPAPRPKQEAAADYTAFFDEAHKHINDTDYHRGLSAATLERFNIGFVKDWRYPLVSDKVPTSPRLIIPTGKGSYLARDTRPNIKDFAKQKVGRTHLLNPAALHSCDKPVYIVEGEIDALSIIDVGGEAVGLGGIANTRLLYNELDKERPTQPLILALDNDEPGERTCKEIEAALQQRGIPFYRHNPAGVHKDANEALNANRDEFAAAVREGELKATQEKGPQVEALNDERDEYRIKNSAEYYWQALVSNGLRTNQILTGFSMLDTVLDGGLYDGLYFIGAESSNGKTTIALQIADSIAASGHDVLFFSLEMAATELIAKSISRLTYQLAKEQKTSTSNALSVHDITVRNKFEKITERGQELYSDATVAYCDIAPHVYIIEGVGNIGAEQIREAVEKHIRVTGHKPVVFIDYLQLIAPYDVRATDKQNIDKAVMELKRISRDERIPVIGISSFNRGSYDKGAAMESFKESGAIEYSCDVLLGLQFTNAGSEGYDRDTEKRKPIRDILVKVLKNRNGPTGKAVQFNFYPVYNYFEQKSIKGDN